MKTIRELFDTLPCELQNHIYEYIVDHRVAMNKVFDEIRLYFIYLYFRIDKYYLNHCYHCNHILNDKYNLIFTNGIRYKYCMSENCRLNIEKPGNVWVSRLQN